VDPALRRADRSSISSFHLADLGGEAVNSKLLSLRLMLQSEGSCEAIPSEPPSLAHYNWRSDGFTPGQDGCARACSITWGSSSYLSSVGSRVLQSSLKPCYLGLYSPLLLADSFTTLGCKHPLGVGAPAKLRASGEQRPQSERLDHLHSAQARSSTRFDTANGNLVTCHANVIWPEHEGCFPLKRWFRYARSLPGTRRTPRMGSSVPMKL
jgi:hypothetical protein